MEKPLEIPFDFHSLTPVQVRLEKAELQYVVLKIFIHNIFTSDTYVWLKIRCLQPLLSNYNLVASRPNLAAWSHRPLILVVLLELATITLNNNCRDYLRTSCYGNEGGSFFFQPPGPLVPLFWGEFLYFLS